MGRKLEKICKTCGKEMILSPAQSLKKMCTECSYSLKKIRGSLKYWEKKDNESIRYKYWLGRYQAINKLLKK